MLPLRLTDAAEADLAEIWACLAVETSEATATKQLARIHDQMKQFCGYPGIGAPREQFAKGLRVGFESPYAIQYIASATELAVIRVLHGPRDAAALAQRGGFDP
jgi:toxin ParE1/3/4